jgi:hypothetical protein
VTIPNAELPCVECGRPRGLRTLYAPGSSEEPPTHCSECERELIAGKLVPIPLERRGPGRWRVDL